MSKKSEEKSKPIITYGSLTHHLISAINTGLIMPAIETGGEKIQTVKNSMENSPTIIMFGWTGCTHRYLAKYEDIYENKGFNMVRCIASTANTTSYNPYEYLADDILSKLPNETWKNPIFFHLFSMNGSMSFLTLWKKLSKAQKNQVQGVIFDSAPVYSTSIRSGDVVSDAALGSSSDYSWLSKKAYKFLLTSIFVMHQATMNLRSLFDKDAFAKYHPYFILLKMDLPKNLMFLYSKTDEVCTYVDIQKFHDIMKQKGHIVDFKCWDDSPHVEHYRYHAEEYAQLCQNFIGNSLNDENIKCKV